MSKLCEWKEGNISYRVMRHTDAFDPSERRHMVETKGPSDDKWFWHENITPIQAIRHCARHG